MSQDYIRPFTRTVRFVNTKRTPFPTPEAPDNFNNFMSFMIGAIDAILASQNAALAAEAEGLGICYMGTTLASCGIVHRETYQPYANNRIAEIYEEKEIRGWNRYMEMADLRETVLAAGATNLAQVYTKVKYTEESHREYSARVLECLRRQNFI